MPEVQFFGLPTETINAGAVATVTYLKAEDSSGHLHDILGKHVTLPYNRTYGYYTYFRVYIGQIQNIKSSDKKLYFAVCNTSGQTVESSMSTENLSYPYLDFSVYGGYFQSPAFFEFFIISANDEKIVLSNGYTGGAT